MFTEQNVPTEEPSPSPTVPAEQPRATAATRPTPAERTDGYVDVGYGTSIPAGGAGDCTGSAYIHIASVDWETIAELALPENLVDMGPRQFAEGEVGYDDQGRIATYTVAPGDVDGVIGDRFCIYNGIALGMLNGHKGYEPIQPGEVLVINPAAVPDFEYHNPYN
ncbi:hypothetical protein [Demequina sp.]|uniref:hypothetical protein n=1 Tax=Demequina sp. TaxID=2050685 RepID=UPI0025BC7157|nr:hypothetical protein [Demequina sp.]